MLRKLIFIMLIFFSALHLEAQQANCTFKPPTFTINFGSGDADDLNSMVSPRYTRVATYCPSDGYFAFSPYTGNCFSDDWFTLTEDHTAGDKSGNMLLINSSPLGGRFFATSVKDLKSNTTYEFFCMDDEPVQDYGEMSLPFCPTLLFICKHPMGKMWRN